MIWALVGTSTIATQYMIPALRANQGSLAWAVSTTQARADAFAKAHDIPAATSDLAQMLADPAVDAVYISSTNEKHFAQAMAAIAAGKHVLCEKPLALTLDEAARMVRAARDAGVIFGTNHHLRCAGSHHAIRNLIAANKIGRVLSLRIFHAVHLPENLRGWRLEDPAGGGGVIADIAVHNADVARFLLNEDPVSVAAIMASTGLGRGAEDSAMSVWTMPSGAMVQSHESFTHPFAGSGLQVHGTEGSIFADGIMTQNPVGQIELVHAQGREAVPFETHDLYTFGVGRFHDAVLGRGAPAASGVDGVKSLAVALAIRTAAQSGQHQRISYGETL